MATLARTSGPSGTRILGLGHYRPNNIVDQIIWRYPAAKLLLNSPATQVVRWAQAQFPAVTISFDLARGYALSDAVAAIARAERTIEMPSSVNGSFSGDAAEFGARIRELAGGARAAAGDERGGGVVSISSWDTPAGRVAAAVHAE